MEITLVNVGNQRSIRELSADPRREERYDPDPEYLDSVDPPHYVHSASGIPDHIGGLIAEGVLSPRDIVRPPS